MTTLKLDTLSDRIKAHKNALVNIVKPPVCTERAQHYTEMYQQHLDKPIPVRRALALAHHLANRTIWIKHDELIIGNQASEVRAAPIFPEYTVSWIEKEIDDLADRPGAGFAVSEENKRVLHEVCPWWRGQTVQDRCYGMFTDEQKGLLATGIIKASRILLQSFPFLKSIKYIRFILNTINPSFSSCIINKSNIITRATER